jgi:hypothetical protein
MSLTFLGRLKISRIVYKRHFRILSPDFCDNLLAGQKV